jgi:hypothetical protein
MVVIAVDGASPDMEGLCALDSMLLAVGACHRPYCGSVLLNWWQANHGMLSSARQGKVGTILVCSWRAIVKPGRLI